MSGSLEETQLSPSVVHRSCWLHNHHAAALAERCCSVRIYATRPDQPYEIALQSGLRHCSKLLTYPLSIAVSAYHVCVDARMISRAALARSGQRTIQCPSLRCNNRGLATAASGTFSYQTGDAAGVKTASRDLPGPTTHLAVVAKAGTRYEPLPGFSDGLEKFAFKNTFRRSALRIVRETELLGGEISAYHSRENLILSAKFLRDDLPYFVELLGEVISQTKFSGKHFPIEAHDQC